MITSPGPEGWLALAQDQLQHGHQREAESALLQGVQLFPQYAGNWQLLARLSVETGKYTQGLFAAWQANSLQASPEMQAAFARCLNHVAITAHDPQLQTAVAKAVSETWGAPAELAEQAGKLLKLDPLIAPHLENIHQVFTGSDIKSLNQHPLLNALLQSAPLCDLALEQFLTKLRKTLLLNPTFIESAPELTASLAQQCFINEYIYPVSDVETAALKTLANPAHLLIQACYQPLHTCAEAETWSTKPWPEPLQAVIQQQIIEPRQEVALAAAMPALTPISEGVSQAVQAMYEESPYPRWVRTQKASAPQSLNAFLSNTYPLSGFVPLASDNPLHVLIAGGGTGQHPLHTARRFTGAQVQVIDLSRRSLAYAQRKTQELGLNNLQFAQADILQIGQLSDFIKAQNFGNTPEAIRACRQHLIAHSQSNDIGSIFLLRDFYSTSACRDLLFHVQEHQLTIPEIDAFLQSHGLRFIGFETDANTLNTYRQEFPGDPASTNLSNWHQFEQRHSSTFISMYQFWVQRVK